MGYLYDTEAEIPKALYHINDLVSIFLNFMYELKHFAVKLMKAMLNLL